MLMYDIDKYLNKKILLIETVGEVIISGCKQQL